MLIEHDVKKRPLRRLRFVLFSAAFLFCTERISAQEKVPASIDIIAIEYPPYTSPHLPENGIAFQALTHALKRFPGERNELRIQPQFLPPGRASFYVSRGQWSASFYPPKQVEPGYDWIKLDGKLVELGLFRLRYTADPAENAADWPELAAMTGKVAIGRQANPGGRGLQSVLKDSQLEFVQVDSPEQGFQLLAKGRVDYVFSEKVAGFYIAQGLSTDEVVLEFSQKPMFTTYIGLWVNRKRTAGEQLYKALKGYQPVTSDTH